jgi:hypothetical protein
VESNDRDGRLPILGSFEFADTILDPGKLAGDDPGGCVGDERGHAHPSGIGAPQLCAGWRRSLQRTNRASVAKVGQPRQPEVHFPSPICAECSPSQDARRLRTAVPSPNPPDPATAATATTTSPCAPLITPYWRTR